jgi:tRNA (guanine-N7-)-methyltransferase
MAFSTSREKGGKHANTSMRMRENVPNVELSDDVVKQYLIHYSNKDLYEGYVNPPANVQSWFHNNQPTHLDFGCGRGEFVVENAIKYPSNNWMGIEFHLKSILLGVDNASNYNISNAKFIHTDFRRILPYVPDGEVASVHIQFPPPITDPKKDLLTIDQISEIHRVLEPEGIFTFASDAADFFIQKCEFIYSTSGFSVEWRGSSIEPNPQTRYQKVWQKKGIATNRIHFMKR